MFPLKEKFISRGPVCQVPADWFETVAKILNHLRGVNCRIRKTVNPDEDNPWKVIVGDVTPDTGEEWTTADLYKVNIILPDPTLGVPRPQWDYPRAHP